MKLDVLSKENCERVRLWRNSCLETLRTPYPLTEKQQEEFYEMTVCNPESPHRYYAIVLEEKKDPLTQGGEFIGMGGITNIQWENSLAEISLILGPEYRYKGYGEQAVLLLLDEAFHRLNLKTVCAECYLCNPAFSFWSGKMMPSYTTPLVNRKFWNGKYCDSSYMSWDRADFEKLQAKKRN